MKRLLPLLVLAALLAPAAHAANADVTGLVPTLWWDFETQPDAAQLPGANKGSASGFTFNSEGTATYRAGADGGKALDASTFTPYSSKNNSFSTAGGPFTLSLVMNLGSTQNGIALNLRNETGERDLIVRRGSTAGALVVGIGPQASASTTLIGMTFADGDSAWHLVSVVVKETGTDLYVDGELADSTTDFTPWTASGRASRLQFGSHLGGVQSGWNEAKGGGCIDDLRVHDAALTPAQMRAIAAEYGLVAVPDTLSVSGLPGNWGTVVPAYGVTNGLARGDVLACSAAGSETAATKTIPLGHSLYALASDGTRTLVEENAATSFSYVHGTEAGQLVWHWAQSNLVTVSAGANGSVSAGGWAGYGDPFAVTATPDPGCKFSRWTGDTAGIDILSASVVVPSVTAPISLAAEFLDETADETVQYVSPDGDDGNPGYSAAAPKKSIAAAVRTLVPTAVASGRTCTVHVAPGVYSEAAASTAALAAVVVTNAISIVGDPAAPESVVVKRDTSVNNRMFYLNHPDALVSGLTISGGNPTTATLSGNGGNVYLDAAGGMVSDCIITNGTAYGAWNTGGGNVCMAGGRVVRCRIVKGNSSQCNEWGMPGGGVRITGGVLENCLVAGNSASYAGVYITGTSARVVNCTVADNVGTESAGIHAKNTAAGQVANCLMVGNRASNDETGHAHVWSGASSNNFVNCAGEVAINDTSILCGESFRDIAAGDFRPIAGSPCIDAGASYASTAATSPLDLDRNARVSGAAVDIGAYEFDQNALSVGFSADRTEGTIPLAVAFTAEPAAATGAVSYQWDVDGDGWYDLSSDTPTVSYTYTAPGTYAVTVRAEDENGGVATFTRTDYVRCVPRELYASPGNAGAAWPYATPATAAATLADAVAAAGDGSVVHVLPGVYSVSSTVRISSGITLSGTTGNPEDAVVDGRNAVRGFILDNPGARLENLAVQNCKVATEGDAQGGSVAIYAGGGTVSNCVLRGGSANSYWASAGGVDVRSPRGLVTHCVVTNCTIGSSNEGFGCAAVMLRAGGRLENSLVAHNHATYARAAVGFYGSIGGSVANCTIVDNSSPILAGIELSSVGFATNCVLAGNFATQGGTEILDDGAVTNKIPVLRPFSGTSASAVACATDRDVPVNATCFVGTPETFFRDYAGGDFRPGNGSILIDHGAALAGYPACDLTGRQPRKIGSRVDIGCYEANAAGSILILR